MNALSHTVVLYGLGASALAVTLLLFLTVSQQVRRVDRRLRSAEANWTERGASASEMLESFDSAVREMRAAIDETDRRVGLLSPSAPLIRCMNLNKRTEALRLARTGKRTDEIASMLHLPQNEVTLLLKIHSAVIERL